MRRNLLIAFAFFAASSMAAVSAARAADTSWIVPHGGAAIDSDAAPRPLQGLRAPDVTADGLKIVFSAAGDLWTVDLDPKNWTQGKPPKGKHFTKDAFLEFDPMWSPDGKQLAYVSDRGGKPEIWLHEMKTNKDRQLTTLVETVEAPSWSPDSNRIAFYKVSSVGDPSVRTLSVVTVFTGDVRDLHTNVRAVAPPAWSPDGETLAMKDIASGPPRSTAKFRLVSLKGAPDRFVTPDGGLAPSLKRGEGPVWSPDGSKMAYVEGGTLRVVPVAPKGVQVGEVAGPSHVITEEIADSPRWFSDSKSLLFVSTDRLKRVALDGSMKDLQPNLAWKRNIPAGQTVVWAGRLWDGATNTYRENVDIVIDGNVISAVEPHRQRDARVRTVNAARSTVIPGLIDSRVTLTAAGGERLGRLLLSYGITTVRDWGVDPYDALERRESWSSGRREGPRELFTSIVMGEKVSAAETGRAKQLGYDIALNQRPTDASGNGLVFGIADGAKSAASAIVMPGLAAMGGFVATLTRNPDLVDHGQIDALFNDDEQAALKAQVTDATATLPTIERSVGAAQNALRAFSARGGNFILASGAPRVPYGVGFLVECQLAQQSGLSALQVLRAVTTGAAVAAGIDKQVGTLEVGKLADLVIIDGDPLKQVSDLANVTGVIADGHYYIIDELLRH
jgi:Tol biopolymer transport system component